MSVVQPLISIKAGKCAFTDPAVVPEPDAGLLYLYVSPEDELLHFCWKKRSDVSPVDDLLIFPGEARFLPFEGCPTGRVFVLKFSSSSQRHFFWLQSESQGPNKEPGFWSERDRNWGKRIDRILQGIDGEAPEDEEMGDAPATSEEVEEEGEAARRGGEDGGRANPPASSAPASASAPALDLASLLAGIQVPGSAQQQQTPTLSLHDLLSSTHTTHVLDAISPTTVDALVSNLPPALMPKDASTAQKKEVLGRIFRTPQLAQSLVSLTVALREGGLRGVADSLRIPLRPGEEAAGDMVEVFVNGVRREVEKEAAGEKNDFAAAEDAP